LAASTPVREVAPSTARLPRSLRVVGIAGSAPHQSPALNPARIPALDGLRGIAILLVFMRHSVFGLETNVKPLAVFLKAGQLTWSGVDLFFVLSGFLIGGILLEARNSPRYFKTFYIRRAYRIFPIYGIVTAAFLFRHLPFQLIHVVFGNSSPLTVPWFSYATLTQNVWMVPLGWFGPTAMTATWSLAVEEQFYLTIPLLIRKVGSRVLIAVLVTVIFAAPILRLILNSQFRHGNFACYVLTPCRADALCLGVLAACLMRKQRFRDLLLCNRKSLCAATFLFFLGVMYMTHAGWSPFAAPMNTFGYSWLALFYTGCLLVALASGPGRLQTLLSNRILMGMGTIAYCSYLIHMPLIQAFRRILAHLNCRPAVSFLSGGLLE